MIRKKRNKMKATQGNSSESSKGHVPEPEFIPTTTWFPKCSPIAQHHQPEHWILGWSVMQRDPAPLQARQLTWQLAPALGSFRNTWKIPNTCWKFLLLTYLIWHSLMPSRTGHSFIVSTHCISLLPKSQQSKGCHVPAEQEAGSAD